jgi:hypothetical protein
MLILADHGIVDLVILSVSNICHCIVLPLFLIQI